MNEPYRFSRPRPLAEPKTFRPGDRVRIAPNGLPMEVLEMDGRHRVIVKWESKGSTYLGCFETFRMERIP